MIVHKVNVTRNGKVIDKLASAKISVLHSEEELQAQMYHGELNINILLDDLREGDHLDYSFSRYGANPIYQGIFAYGRSLNWSVPVQNQYLRVLWGKNKPLHITKRFFEPNIVKRKLGEFTEYLITVTVK